MMGNWWDKANCRGADITIFFPDLETSKAGAHVWARAKAFCNGCPVRLDCLEFQMPFEEITGRRDGMFGGLTPRERDTLAYYRRKPQSQGRGNLRPGPTGRLSGQ